MLEGKLRFEMHCHGIRRGRDTAIAAEALLEVSSARGVLEEEYLSLSDGA